MKRLILRCISIVKNAMPKIKNVILKTTIGIAVAVALITICLIDTNKLAITGTCFASMAYIALFVYANFRDNAEEMK